jgi:hypothetical protein
MLLLLLLLLFQKVSVDKTKQLLATFAQFLNLFDGHDLLFNTNFNLTIRKKFSFLIKILETTYRFFFNYNNSVKEQI